MGSGEPKWIGSADGQEGVGSASQAKKQNGAGRRGRPRDDDIDERILEAGFIELAEGGISHFSVSAVARRAGVAKGTVYLRWPSREQLVLDSSARLVAKISPPRPGPVEQQLLELTEHWAAVFATPRAVELLLRIDADRDKFPNLFRAIFEGVQGAGNRIVERTLREAEKRDEIAIPASTTVLTRMFVGSMFVEALAHTPAGEVSPEFRQGLVDTLMAAFRCSP
jgi:AcrR family transcriptional regulator